MKDRNIDEASLTDAGKSSSTSKAESFNDPALEDIVLEKLITNGTHDKSEIRVTVTDDVQTKEISNLERGEWDNKCSFFLSALGFAVGLGNVWRFPYIAYKYGGGTFLIPYCIMLFSVGLPIFFLEFVIGQYTKSGPIKLFGHIAPIFKGVGYMMVAISAIIAVYYNLIMGWSIYYLFSGFTSELPWATCPKENVEGIQEPCQNDSSSGYFFSSVMQRKNGNEHYLENLGPLHWDLAGCLAAAWFIVCLASIKGVKSSGKVVYFTAIYPYVILVILFGVGLSLPGAFDGIQHYLEPDWEKMQNPDVWKAAASQIFFSLCCTIGGLINMASYNKFKNNVHTDALVISLLNCATSFFAGFVVFAFLGFMAKTKGVDISDVAAGGPGLAFVVYPEGIAQFPEFLPPPLFSFLFFSMLLMLGMDSMLGLVETITSAITDHFTNLRNKVHWVVMACCGLGLVFGLPLCTSGGIMVLDLMDRCTGEGWVLIFVGIIEVVLVSWIYGVDKIFEHIEEMEIHIPAFMKFYWRVCWKYVTPGMLCIILTQMDRSISFMVTLLIIGTILVSMDLFPNLWRKINENNSGRLVTKGIKGVGLFLITCAFWIRVYQNMSDVEGIFTANIKGNLQKDNMTSIVNDFHNETLIKNQKVDEAIFGKISDNIFDKIFEVVLNLILVSIIPAVGAWTAYRRDPELLAPTDEWKKQPDEIARRSRRLSRQESYPNSHSHHGGPF